MPSIMTLSGSGLGKTKRPKKRSSGGKLPLGSCKRVRNTRSGKDICLCNTGKGRSGHQFKKLGSGC